METKEQRASRILKIIFIPTCIIIGLLLFYGLVLK